MRPSIKSTAYLGGWTLTEQQNPDLSGEKPLRISDVALLLQMHINSVRYWADNGLLPCYRVGRRGDRRFRRKDVEEFLTSRRNAQDPAELDQTIK